MEHAQFGFPPATVDALGAAIVKRGLGNSVLIIDKEKGHPTARLIAPRQPDGTLLAAHAAIPDDGPFNDVFSCPDPGNPLCPK